MHVKTATDGRSRAREDGREGLGVKDCSLVNVRFLLHPQKGHRDEVMTGKKWIFFFRNTLHRVWSILERREP